MSLEPPTQRLPPPAPNDLVAIQPFDGPIVSTPGVAGATSRHSDHVNPTNADSGHAALTNVDPAHVDPAHVDPDHVDPDHVDPALLEAALTADRTGFATLSGDGHALAANQVFLDLVGADALDDIRPDSHCGGVVRSLLDHLPNDLLDGVGDTGKDVDVWRGDFDHADGRTLRATVVVDTWSGRPSVGVAPQLSLLVHDVTEARTRIEALRYQATHDQLTGLANRPHILSLLASMVDARRDDPARTDHVAVIFVDLDHLKYINDAFGHRAGDRLIASTAARLGRAVRPVDHVARIGGDEFVVAAQVDDAMVALDLAERVRRALSGHLKVGDLDLEFSVSIGVALTDADLTALPGDEAASLLIAQADSAMYAAKQAGRGRSILFTNRMRSEARDRTGTAAELARAVADESLTVDYQPVYSTVSARAVGVEALVRWQHPRLGQMDPATFISIAEESGVIGRLGEQVLGHALDDLADWQRSGRVDERFSVHVNVSQVQLASSRFVSTVLTALRERGLSPRQLVLEARETSLLGRAGDVDRSVRSLRRSGVQVAVDNFGSGPKALAVMTDIGADILKLDGSLTLPAGSTETETRLVRAVVLLAHALEMNVIAERVTSHDQLERLRAAGCDMVQGNFLAEPLAAEALDLESRPW